MGKVTGFLEIDRQDRKYAPAADRIRHYKEFVIRSHRERHEGSGGALHELRHSVLPQPAARSTTRSRTGTIWSIAATGRKPLSNLHSTNNFPEFTGRVCPAPCEASCTLNIDDNAGHHQDHRMRDRRPRHRARAASPTLPRTRQARSVAIVGSGPAGLAAAAATRARGP